jgi:hypothetical protein
MSAGKGDSPRSCFSREYRENWDGIFGKAKGERLKAKGASKPNSLEPKPLAPAPRTDACPHCGSPRTDLLSAYWTCKAHTTQRDEDGRTHLCREREAHRKTCENAQREIEFLIGWKQRAVMSELDLEAERDRTKRLLRLMRDYIDFMNENLGTTADWPMEAAFDNEETCERHCDLLNAMKRLVKPEKIL